MATKDNVVYLLWYEEYELDGRKLCQVFEREEDAQAFIASLKPGRRSKYEIDGWVVTPPGSIYGPL